MCFVSGVGLSRRESGVGLAGSPGAAYGAHRGILSRSGVPLRLFAERQTLHQAARAARRGLRPLRTSAKPEWRGWQGEPRESRRATKAQREPSRRALYGHRVHYRFIVSQATDPLFAFTTPPPPPPPSLGENHRGWHACSRSAL